MDSSDFNTRSSPIVTIRLFGTFSVDADGVPIQRFSTAKARALLAYLALNPDQPINRSVLATLLWPDTSDQNARDNLRNTLHRLRKTLANGVEGTVELLTATRQAVELHGATTQIDAVEFQHGLDAVANHEHAALDECPECLTVLEDAVALYREQFLAGLDIPDAEPFEEWMSLRREFFAHRVRHALAELIAAHEARGEYGRAQRFAEQYLVLDPLHEETHRSMMRLLARQDLPDLALSHHTALRERLQQELGVEPDSVTARLALEISQGTYAASAPVKPAGGASATAERIGAIKWGDAPQVAAVYGREEEIVQLSEWLTEADHRAVAILGLGGMGKTTLAANTARRLTDHFDAVIWRSLINAPTLEELLRPLLQHVQRTQGYAHPPASVDEQLAHLFSYLQANRVLLVLDNMETILDEANAGRFRAGYESYGQLIRQMIQRPHKSRLLFTSRERPNEFHRLEMDQATVHSLRLDGLDVAATSQILQQRGIHATPDDEAALRQRYSGNPLALKLVADTVKEIFDGDIELFLTEESLVFDDVRTVLDQQFDRLSPLEEDILLWLTVARTPLAAQELRSRLLKAPSQRALLEAIGALQRRSLIERRAHGFHLQNVVADYLTSLLIDQICAEIERGELVRLHSHGLINAHADDDVRQSQVRLLLRPVAELTAARLGPAALVENLRNMLSTLRMTAQRTPSYAGGNLLNLLLHESASITGLDASKIAIWHAYLRGVKLPDADFREADLAHSVFNDTFGAVYSVAISPDGQLFAAGTADGEVRLWRMADGQPLSIITGHHDSVWSIAFSPDGKSLASASADKTTRIWDLETLAPLHILRGHDAALQTIAFHPDGQLLATAGGDQIVTLWHPQEGTILRTLRGPTSWIRDLTFSADGSLLVCASADNRIYVWDVETGALRTTLAGHSSGVDCVALSPDGKTLASGGEDSTVLLWDLATGEIIARLMNHASAVRSVIFSPDGRSLATGGDDRTIRLWDVETAESYLVLLGHSNWVLSLAFTQDGEMLLSGGEDQTVRTWNTATGEQRNSTQGYTNWVYCIDLSPDGRTLLSGNGDHLIRLWDVDSGQELKSLRGHSNWVWAAAFSPDGQSIASASGDTDFRLWDVTAATTSHMLEGHERWVRAVAFSPDGQLLASGSGDHAVGLWEADSGKRLHWLTGHGGWVRDVAFHPASTLLASASEDQTIRLWQVDTGGLQQVLTGHTSRVDAVAFTPDGATLISGSEDQTVRLWDVASGACRNVLTGHDGWVRAVAVSPDGKQLASGSHDRTVRLWDLASGALLRVLDGHRGWVTSVLFAADGRTLFSGNSDGTIKRWDLETGECIHTFKHSGPYDGMKLAGAVGLSHAQRTALLVLGAEE